MQLMKTNNRIIGLDILRALAAFFVVILHANVSRGYCGENFSNISLGYYILEGGYSCS